MNFTYELDIRFFLHIIPYLNERSLCQDLSSVRESSCHRKAAAYPMCSAALSAYRYRRQTSVLLLFTNYAVNKQPSPEYLEQHTWNTDSKILCSKPEIPFHCPFAQCPDNLINQYD